MRGIKVADYNGKGLNVSEENFYTTDYKGREAALLHRWFKEIDANKIKSLTEERQGQSGGKSSLSGDVKLIAEIQNCVNDEVRTSGGEICYSIDAFPSFFFTKHKDNFVYQACPECRKKVSRDYSTGHWRCERCNKTYEDSTATWMILVRLTDCSGDISCNFYADQAKSIIHSISADDCQNMLAEGKTELID